MDENIGKGINDPNLKPAQRNLIAGYTAELEGELTKCWSQVCKDYGLDLEENYENFPYAIFACGFLDGAKLGHEKIMTLYGLNK